MTALSPDQGTFAFCPDSDCLSIAEVMDRQLVESTDGPVEIARVQCLQGHRFHMPTERLRV